MNGVPLSPEAPSVPRFLLENGWRTSLFGKAHFEPLLDPFLRQTETKLALQNSTDLAGEAYRGFEHVELAGHGALGPFHHGQWIRREHPEHLLSFAPVLDRSFEVSADRGGETGAPQVHHNVIPRGLYHTDWIVDRALTWLDSLQDEESWFCWLSFPDPHHPWDPPASELHRVPWRELDLPPAYPEKKTQREAQLDQKGAHWRRWYDGTLVTNYEAPAKWVPATLTANQIREINAMAHIENELIDEGLNRLISRLEERGWNPDLDIIYTTDHGEFQGDHGLLFKGPYHVDSLMRLPLIWRPAPSLEQRPDVVASAVGLIDLAPTFCEIANLQVPEWMEGIPLPRSQSEAESQGREHVLTEWDSVHPNGSEVHMQSIYQEQFLCTRYEAGTCHEGSEGELYDLFEDPQQSVNRWEDPAYHAIREDLLINLSEKLPPRSEKYELPESPV